MREYVCVNFVYNLWMMIGKYMGTALKLGRTKEE